MLGRVKMSDESKRLSLRIRFQENVRDKGEGCWEWGGNSFYQGYGMIWDGYKMERAHRVSYAFNVGPIPAGMFVCHTCDNRKCVNPAHLFIGRAVDNVRDMVAKGRKKPYRKLSKEKAREVIAASGTQREIANKYGISQSRVCVLKQGKYAYANQL